MTAELTPGFPLFIGQNSNLRVRRPTTLPQSTCWGRHCDASPPSFKWRKNGVRGLWRFHRLSCWQFKSNGRGTRTPWNSDSLEGGHCHTDRATEPPVWLRTWLIIFRLKTRGPGAKPRKQVGHERGKFACYGASSTLVKDREWEPPLIVYYFLQQGDCADACFYQLKSYIHQFYSVWGQVGVARWTVALQRSFLFECFANGC